MNVQQKHNALTSEYSELSQKVRKLRVHAFIFQAAIWVVILALKKLQAPYLALITATFFGVFLLSRIKNFNLRRTIDNRMSQITLEGLSIEKKNPRIETFFHQVLEQFGIIRIILLRAIFDIMALYFFANAMYQVCLNYNPDLAINFKNYYPLLAF